MENITIGWTHWLLFSGALILFYTIIAVSIQLIRRNTVSSTIVSKIIDFLRSALILLEPIGLGIILMTFALINPIVHGPLVLVTLALVYIPLRNYMTGRLLLLNQTFAEGQRIKVGGNVGTVVEVERMGLELQVKEGIRFINYSNLISDGYTKLEGTRLEGIHHLEIVPTEKIADQTVKHLENKFFLCPYIDWFHLIKVTTIEKPNHQMAFKARLMVQKDQHLQYLINLIREWGYDCKNII